MTFGGVLSIIWSGHDIPSDLPQIIHSLSRHILLLTKYTRQNSEEIQIQIGLTLLQWLAMAI